MHCFWLTQIFALTSLEEKLYLMEKNGVKNVVVVPFTIEFSQLSSREYLEKFIIERFKPKCLVVGYDHRFGLNREGNFDLLQIYARVGPFELVEIKKEEIDDITVSSTKIRKAVEEGNILSDQRVVVPW
jgi:FAD synthase